MCVWQIERERKVEKNMMDNWWLIGMLLAHHLWPNNRGEHDLSGHSAVFVRPIFTVTSQDWNPNYRKRRQTARTHDTLICKIICYAFSLLDKQQEGKEKFLKQFYCWEECTEEWEWIITKSVWVLLLLFRYTEICFSKRSCYTNMEQTDVSQCREYCHDATNSSMSTITSFSFLFF